MEMYGMCACMAAGPETRRWADGKCMVYDTTFEHETFNESTDQERVRVIRIST